MGGKVPHPMITGDLCEVYILWSFDWYEWVNYSNIGEALPYPTEHLGRYMVHGINKGNEIILNLLPEGIELPIIQIIWILTQDEFGIPTEKIKR